MTREFKEIIVMSAVLVAVLLLMTRCGSEQAHDFTYAPQCVQDISGQMICRLN